MMFRVFNGERVQPEKECWMASGPLCTVVFYPITIFGNFLVNLFMNRVEIEFDSFLFINLDSQYDTGCSVSCIRFG